ncbi:phosphoglucosamine mutase [Oceanicella actignis]|uniref:Phosphoglucosamine mutase n=1 Tax=Oceanicella actignis TaxID=1189325 RepID=A0A1M7TUC7_9RHOB|nr:phosphoglucosamine mutase [Oceanicella actignis]TYO90506.1 phosphoglucosamine mutase [Oceanicella actignis]SES78401.1 phosphoglucosamine mutase [Oceanicella actignis]SHN74310.1 phosphoglucosamine mutase [Oceanicella actignis]
MTRKLFGTDGVRGRANEHPMTAEIAMKLGQAAGRRFLRGRHRHRVVIGKDTRLSGYMIESALTAGFVSVGMDVFLLGPAPTPAVGMLTKSLRADAGVMISASHNPFHDNGIKLFGPDGFKLSDKVEAEIEAMMERPIALADAADLGRAKRIDDALGRYIEAAKATFPRHLRLDGLRVVLDCANGAAYKTAPAVLWELGAEVIKIGVEPNGLNINAGVGSTAPDLCRRTVVETGAHLGVALDGDADRVHIIDEKGEIVDGDQIMALIAERWLQSRRLAGGTLVATVMSNLGLERHLAARGVRLLRTRVGDRYVVEAMREGGFNLGGEQSGHIVMTDHASTGDGLLAALQVLAAVAEEGRPASEVCARFSPLPQVLRNVRYAPGAAPLDAAEVRRAIAAAEARLAGAGRVLIRKSGTEPLIRVMAEGEDPALVEAVVAEICAAVEDAAA